MEVDEGSLSHVTFLWRWEITRAKVMWPESVGALTKRRMLESEGTVVGKMWADRLREVWGSGEERDGKLLGWMQRGASSLSWRDLKRAWATAWEMGWRVLSRSTAWDTVPGAGLRPVHLHPPGICIWEKKGEISGVEASGEKCPWQPASSWRGPCFA